MSAEDDDNDAADGYEKVLKGMRQTGPSELEESLGSDDGELASRESLRHQRDLRESRAIAQHNARGGVPGRIRIVSGAEDY